LTLSESSSSQCSDAGLKALLQSGGMTNRLAIP